MDIHWHTGGWQARRSHWMRPVHVSEWQDRHQEFVQKESPSDNSTPGCNDVAGLVLTINQTNPDHTRDAANSRCGRLAAPMVCPYPTRSGPSDATPLAADRHDGHWQRIHAGTCSRRANSRHAPRRSISGIAAVGVGPRDQQIVTSQKWTVCADRRRSRYESRPWTGTSGCVRRRIVTFVRR